jgi:hypothetical protein
MISNIAHAQMKTKALIIPYAVGGIFVVVGTYIASKEVNYELLIPLVLIVGSLLTFWLIFNAMNKIIHMGLKITNFIQILFYSLAFASAMLWYEYSANFYISTAVVFVFSLYFLFVLYRFIKLHGVTV